MNPVLKSRTLTEILASRTKNTNKNRKAKTHQPTIVESHHEWKLETFAKKGNYNNEDKIALIRFIEKKYRVRFGLPFVAKCFNWVVETGRAVIDRHYDSTKRSLFLVRGKVALCKKAHLLR